LSPVQGALDNTKQGTCLNLDFKEATDSLMHAYRFEFRYFIICECLGIVRKKVRKLSCAVLHNALVISIYNVLIYTVTENVPL
jgi:hypothetical protein